jgi:hypothetical protein
VPVTNWNQTVINGKQYLVIEVAQLMIPLNWDPSSNVFIAVAAPTGGLLNYPALVQGNPGPGATMSNTINFTPLAASNPTPASASLTTLSPGFYQLNLALHEGASATGSVTTISAAVDLSGTPVAGSMIVLNSGLNGFVYTAVPVGDRVLPGAILNAPSGNPQFTMAQVSLGPYPFDWRPTVFGHTIVAPLGSDCVVDLFARWGTTPGQPFSGNIVGSCHGIGGITERLTLDSASPPGSPDSYDRVPAGQAATIYFNLERRSGSTTFTAAAATSAFEAAAIACPITLATGLP